VSTLEVEQRAENRKLGLKLALIVPVMLVFCATLVPLYRVICEQLGITQSRAVAAQNTQVDKTRSVHVELVASRNLQLGWVFEPMERKVTVHPGELTTVRYRVVNTDNRPVVGRAVPSISPLIAGQYFEKIECFCFSDQKLQPGEAREMPVVFRVKPELDKDIGTISLSYTFFDVTASVAKQ
jgi:cytochrome c oxidase assembly protein subunit 11